MNWSISTQLNCLFFLSTQNQRGIPWRSLDRFACNCNAWCWRFWSRRTRSNRQRYVALVCIETNEEITNCRDASETAHYVRERHYVRGQLWFHCKVVQNVQRPKISVHADGELSGRWTVDHFTWQRTFRWCHDTLLHCLRRRSIWLFALAQHHLSVSSASRSISTLD